MAEEQTDDHQKTEGDSGLLSRTPLGMPVIMDPFPF